MKAICTSDAHLLSHGPNQSFGNHMLHLYAAYSFSKANDVPLIITQNSNLDELFNLSAFKQPIQPTSCMFREEWGGDVFSYYEKEKRNYTKINDVLNKRIDFDEISSVEGWFWNKILLPPLNFFDAVDIKDEYKKYVNEKSYIFNPSCLVIHYRGTDFKNHSIGFGDIRLRREYYDKCIDHFCNNNTLKMVVVVTEDIIDAQRIINIPNKSCVFESNNYLIDWLILFYCRNLVCSNSSFCYTAGCYNKSNVYQPHKFFTRYLNVDFNYPIDPYYSNSIIL